MVYGMMDCGIMHGYFWPFGAALAGIWGLVMLLVLIFWIWMIVDCAKRNFKNDVEKIVWIVVIVLGWWLVGALVYYIVVKASNPHGLMKK